MFKDYTSSEFVSFKMLEYKKALQQLEKSLNEADREKKEKEFDILLGYLWNEQVNTNNILFTEMPDFILDGEIGVEIVELKPDPDYREQDNTINEIFKKIEVEIKKDSRISNVSIEANFKQIRFKKSDVDNLVKDIINELCVLYNDFFVGKKEQYYSINSNKINSQYFTNIKFIRGKTLGLNYNYGGFWMEDSSIENINYTIKNKNNKIKKYCQNLNKNILIIFFDSSDRSSYDFPEESDIEYYKNNVVETGFDKVFLYGTYENKTIELK